MSDRVLTRWMKAGVVTLAGAIVLGGLTWFLATNTSLSVASAESNFNPDSDADLLKISPMFGQSQSGSDTLPNFLLDGPQVLSGVLSKATRMLAIHDEVGYWVAVNDEGKICIVVLLPGQDEVASMTCQTKDYVLAHGLGIQVNDRSHNLRAYFIPANYVAEADRYVQVGSQLIVGDSRYEDATDVVIAAAPDHTELPSLTLFHFSPLGRS